MAGEGGADETGIVIQEGWCQERVWVGKAGWMKERRKQRVGVQAAEM